jgi:hypothetical protein
MTNVLRKNPLKISCMVDLVPVHVNTKLLLAKINT